MRKRRWIVAAVMTAAGVSGANAQQYTVSGGTRLSLRTQDRVCPPLCTSDDTVSGVVLLPRHDPALGTLLGVDVQVVASGSGSFLWSILASHAPGGYVTNVQVRPSASPPGLGSVSGQFMIPDCGRPVGRFEFEGSCGFGVGGFESAGRTVPAASRSSYSGAGSVAISVQARFQPTLILSGLPFMTWHDELWCDPAVSATYRYCGADYTGDGFLDFFDYSAFVTCFEGLGCPAGRTADLTRDGFVDFFDYDAFVEAFGRGC